MRSRPHDPLRLDVAALAAEGGELDGQWDVATMARLAASQTPPQDVAPDAVSWDARGEQRRITGAEPEIWLHLRARTQVWLTCQRCLQPMQIPLHVDTRVRFARDEAQAEALDAELEDDVLALPRWLDLRSLVEDELLLSLPLVPRHEHCPQPLPVSVGDEALDAAEPTAERVNPFAALQALRRGKPPASG